jgi:Predicted transcriptional regulators
MLESLGAYIRLTRQRRNLTQERLADLAGVSRWQLAQLEKGQNVTISFLLKVAAVLELTEIPLDFLTLRNVPADALSLIVASEAVNNALTQVENAHRGLDGAMATLDGLLARPPVPPDAESRIAAAAKRVAANSDSAAVGRALRESADSPGSRVSPGRRGDQKGRSAR